ncbi:MAG: IreB family regulatory phosphoprotein [Bacilli bacterium]
MINNTVFFDFNDTKSLNIKNEILEIVSNLQELGYDPVAQLTGYIISDDLSYITNFKNSRDIIRNIDKTKLIEVLVREFVNI